MPNGDMKKIAILLAFYLAFTADLGLEAAQSSYVQCQSAAGIKSNNLDELRSIAVHDAMTQCIDDELKNMLGEKKYFANIKLLESFVLDRPNTYVEKYYIENEGIIDSGQRYQVSLKVRIRKSSLEVALVERGITELLDLVPSPTIAILVRERFDTRMTGTRATETTLGGLLSRKGFKVMDLEQRKLIDMRNRIFAEATGDTRAALQAALEVNADYLVFGEASVTSSGPLSGTDLKARFANVSVRMVSASTGEVVATEQASGNAKHLDELTGGNWALERAAEDLGVKLIGRFDEVLRRELYQGADVIVDFYGLDVASQAQEAEKILAKIKDVARVGTKFFYPGLGQFEVRYKGAVGGLADSLQMNKLGGKSIKVLEAQGKYLRVEREGGKIPKIPAREIYDKFIEQKYQQINFEELRQRDQELMAMVKKLDASTKISDEQKKELFHLQKDLEDKKQQFQQSQSVLAQREKELNSSKEKENRLRANLKQINEQMQSIKNETASMKEEHEKELKRLEQEQRNTQEQVQLAQQQTYAADQNFQNATSYHRDSAMETFQAINAGLDISNRLIGMSRGLFGF